MPPNSSKLMLITGATDGIGLESAIQLAQKGFEIIIHGRSQSSVENTHKTILNKVPTAHLHSAIADFTDLKQVKTMAESILKNYSHLDVLLNNAGVYMKSKKLTAQNLEYSYGINHQAHFDLTLQLLPLLKKAPQGRIINVSSMVHMNAEIDFDNLQAEKHFDGYGAHATSKLCNVLFTLDLAHRLKDTLITVNYLHPGVISTKLLHAGFGMGGDSVSNGAKTSIFLASDPSVEKISGKYFVNCAPKASSPLSHDKNLQKQLWEYSEKISLK